MTIYKGYFSRSQIIGLIVSLQVSNLQEEDNLSTKYAKLYFLNEFLLEVLL